MLFFVVLKTYQRACRKFMLRQSKSSGQGTLFRTERLKICSFFYTVIEKTILYFSVLFDQSSLNIKGKEFR
jgi:hypothetical protein